MALISALSEDVVKTFANRQSDSVPRYLFFFLPTSGAEASPALARSTSRMARIAAVTALPVGPKGFVGLAGNVSEWVDTDYEVAPA